jgi:hypothetical protein
MDHNGDTNVQRSNSDVGDDSDDDDDTEGGARAHELYNAKYQKRYLVEVSLHPEHDEGAKEDWPEGVIPM